MDVLSLIGRKAPLFDQDLTQHREALAERVAGGRFLVIGGAGTIGQAVVRELFRRNPAALDVVDLSENNLVELVRDLRSGLGYIDGDFRTFALDAGSAPPTTYAATSSPTGSPASCACSPACSARIGTSSSPSSASGCT